MGSFSFWRSGLAGTSSQPKHPHRFYLQQQSSNPETDFDLMIFLFDDLKVFLSSQIIFSTVVEEQLPAFEETW